MREHQHGVDVCAYCAAGDIARARLMELEKEHDALRELVRAAQVVAEQCNGHMTPSLGDVQALNDALANPDIVALGKEKR